MTVTFKREVITHMCEGAAIASLVTVYPEFENCTPGFEKYAARYYSEFSEGIKEYAKSDIFPRETERYMLDQTPRKRFRYKALLIKLVCEAEENEETLSVKTRLDISRGREKLNVFTACERWRCDSGLLIKRKKTK